MGRKKSATSREATIARAEKVVELLGDCHIREGWRFDKKWGAHFIDALQSWDFNDTEGQEFQVIVDWINGHGQSLDWIIRGDPCSLICGAAAASNPITVSAVVRRRQFEVIEGGAR